MTNNFFINIFLLRFIFSLDVMMRNQIPSKHLQTPKTLTLYSFEFSLEMTQYIRYAKDKKQILVRNHLHNQVTAHRE